MEGLLKDRAAEAKRYFHDTLDELDELCEGVEYPRGELEYQHYFCGESGVDSDQDEAYARVREKLYALRLHKAIVKARQDGFRNNPVKENKIKRALYQILNDEDEVERIYQIVVEQEEY